MNIDHELEEIINLATQLCKLTRIDPTDLFCNWTPFIDDLNEQSL